MIYVSLPNDEIRQLSFYLALEEYVARQLAPADYFFMWQVKPSVIFGRNQLIENEVNLDYCRSHNIQMFRRKSGGGCVYADMNNVMMSYITADDQVGFTFNRYISMVVLAIYLFLIVLGVYVGSHLLLGITGTLKGSPLYDGLMFLLMLAVCLPSLVYGLSTETFRTAGDCVNAFCTILPPFAHFLVTMLVGAQLLQTLEYTNIDLLLGISNNAMRIISFLVYWLPLPIILVWYQKSGKEV